MKKYNKDGNFSKSYIDMMRNYYKRHLESNTKYLHQCYIKPSTAKLNAMYKIHYKSDSAPHILSHNTFHFTASYFIQKDDISIFVVETGRNIYEIPLFYL